MNLKKSYVEKYGYERVVTDRNSALVYAETDMLKLADGQSYQVDELGKEFVLVVLYGRCEVKGEGFTFAVGKRANVFEGAAETAYIGKDTPFTVTAKDGDVKIAVCKAPAEKYYKPYQIKAEDVIIKTFGKGSFVRDVAFTFPESGEANHLYIGEFWVEDGKWGSYPPHKHDVDNLPTEGALDEIYYYEFDKSQGFGVGFNGDDCYKVEDQGVLCITPMKTHQQVAAAGYSMCYVWMIRHLENDPWIKTRIDDPDHKWLLDV
jgi:5-deoxy-glucuronate isomerase